MYLLGNNSKLREEVFLPITCGGSDLIYLSIRSGATVNHPLALVVVLAVLVRCSHPEMGMLSFCKSGPMETSPSVIGSECLLQTLSL